MQMPLNPCDGIAQNQCVEQETSISMLRQVFGPVIDRLITGQDPAANEAVGNILASMLQLFNSGLVLVGGILILFIVGIGVTNSANDGEVFGRTWSPTWTSLRMVFGMGILFPTSAGYSFIQLFVLMVALWGVGLANGVYHIGIETGIIRAQSATHGMNQPGMYYGIRSFAQNYLINSYCKRSANSIYGENEPLERQPNVAFNGGQNAIAADRSVVINGTTSDIYEIRDRNPQTNLGGGKSVCGTVSLFNYNAANPRASDAPPPGGNGGNDIYVSALRNSQVLAGMKASIQGVKVTQALALMRDIDRWVSTWPANFEQNNWEGIDVNEFNNIVARIDNYIVRDISLEIQNSGGNLNGYMDSIMNLVRNKGWANAGGWFQRVGIVRGEVMKVSALPVGEVHPPTMDATSFWDPRQIAFRNSVSMAQKVLARANLAAPSDRRDASFLNLSDSMSSILSGFAFNDEAEAKQQLGKLMEESGTGFMSQIITAATGAGGDGTTDFCAGTVGQIGGSLSRIKCVGDYLVVTKMALDAAANLAESKLASAEGQKSESEKESGGLLSRIGNFFKGLIGFVANIFIDPLREMMKHIDHVAFMMSVVLPSMPYILFLVVVTGWLLGVLQTVVAVPLWALLHLTPERTFVGSQAQGYLLMLSLFVRPALAVIGLFMAILISDPLISFVVRGFFDIKETISAGSLGMFTVFVEIGTFLWWLQVLCYVLLAVLYLCFALPQMLPGTVLTWIGGGISDLGESNAVGSVRGEMAMPRKSGVYQPIRAKLRPGEGGKGKGAVIQAPKDTSPVGGGQGVEPKITKR